MQSVTFVSMENNPKKAIGGSWDSNGSEGALARLEPVTT